MQKAAYCVISFPQNIGSGQTHRDRKWISWGLRRGGGVEGGEQGLLLVGVGLLLGGDGDILELDGGDSCTIL